MTKTVISVENLSKSYRLGQIGTGTLSRDLEVWWAKVRGKPNPLLKIGQEGYGETEDRRPETSLLSPVSRLSTPSSVSRPRSSDETLWALKDVSFQVQQGEVLGIIGRNGAGKSTLLKILSRVTAPTRGQIKVKGRIASLLEVGTGFHPELTGRENIFLNGAILGMSRQEVQRKFDEIVSFAEVEKFVDTPVKRYSSGMYVRLAFAVAAHLESEILLVDEVLAVGDAEFQKKCLGKMGDVASKEGRTVLFVSHNMVSINHLCDQALLFQNGNMIARGESADITNKYLYINDNELAQKIWPNKNTAPGNEIVRLHAIRIVSNGKVTSQIPSDQEVILEVDYWNMKPGNCLIVEVRLVESSSGYVFEAFNTQEASGGKDNKGNTPLDPGLYRSKLRIPPNFLNDKHFMFHIMLVRLNPATAEINIPDAISFSILDTPKLRTAGLSGKWMGPIRTTLDWSTELVKKE